MSKEVCRLKNGRIIKKKSYDRYIKGLKKYNDEMRIKKNEVQVVQEKEAKIKVDGLRLMNIEKLPNANNEAVELGAVHSGIGKTAIDNLFVCSDIPPMKDNVYQDYEEQIGIAMEKAADLCKDEANQERKMEIENVKKIDELQ